jgi:hypothetical protein
MLIFSTAGMGKSYHRARIYPDLAYFPSLGGRRVPRYSDFGLPYDSGTAISTLKEIHVERIA